MLRIKKLSEMIGKKVYTDNGEAFGIIEEINILDNKIDGWRIVVSRDSELMNALGGARGIIVPHQYVKAIGDIFIIKSEIIPAQNDEEELPLEDEGII